DLTREIHELQETVPLSEAYKQLLVLKRRHARKKRKLDDDLISNHVKRSTARTLDNGRLSPHTDVKANRPRDTVSGEDAKLKTNPEEGSNPAPALNDDVVENSKPRATTEPTTAITIEPDTVQDNASHEQPPEGEDAAPHDHVDLKERHEGQTISAIAEPNSKSTNTKGSVVNEAPNTEDDENPSPSSLPAITTTLTDDQTDELTAESHKALLSTAHFYLVKPRTMSSRTVLIPLSRNDTLSHCLRQRVVLEFPTIQVLSLAPESLPDRYLLESEYESMSRKELGELDGLLAEMETHVDGDGGAGGEGGGVKADGGPEDVIDDRKILEVLQRDLGA
ncbi:hypothetical protein LTS18_005879, partial [Coniosporium uncinatum]